MDPSHSEPEQHRKPPPLKDNTKFLSLSKSSRNPNAIPIENPVMARKENMQKRIRKDTIVSPSIGGRPSPRGPVASRPPTSGKKRKFNSDSATSQIDTRIFNCKYQGEEKQLILTDYSVKITSTPPIDPSKTFPIPMREFVAHYYRQFDEEIFLFNPKQTSDQSRFKLVLTGKNGQEFRVRTSLKLHATFKFESNPISFSNLELMNKLDKEISVVLWAYPDKENIELKVQYHTGIYCFRPQKAFHWNDSKFTLEIINHKKVLTLENTHGSNHCALSLWGESVKGPAFNMLLKIIRNKAGLIELVPGVDPSTFYAPLNQNAPLNPNSSIRTALWNNASSPPRSRPTSTSSPNTLRVKPRPILRGDVNKIEIDNALRHFSISQRENDHGEENKHTEDPFAKEEPREENLPGDEELVVEGDQHKGDIPKENIKIDLTEKEPEPEQPSNSLEVPSTPKAETSNEVVDMAGDHEEEPVSRSARRRKARQKMEEEEIVVEPTEDDYDLLIAENYNPISYKFWDGKHTDVVIEDIARLNPQVWVNDTIIWFFLRLFVEKLVHEEPDKADKILILDPFFYTSLRSGTTPSWITKVPLTTKDCLIMPINDTFHWLVAIIVGLNKTLDADANDNGSQNEINSSQTDEAKPAIIILDSLGSPVRGFGRKVVTALNNALKALGRTPLNLKRFKILKGEVPNQSNNTDCGVYLIHFMEQFLANPSPVFESAEKSAGPTLEVDADYWKPSEAWKKRIELKSRLKELGDKFPKPQVDTNEMNDGSLDDLEVVEVESISRKKSKSKQNNQAVHVEEVKYSPDIEGTSEKSVNNNAAEKPTQHEKSSSADSPHVAPSETNERREQASREGINQEDKSTEKNDENNITEKTESNEVERSGSSHPMLGEKEEVEVENYASEERSVHKNQDRIGEDEDTISKGSSNGNSEDKSVLDSSVPISSAPDNSAKNTYPSVSASTPKRDESSEEEEESPEEAEEKESPEEEGSLKREGSGSPIEHEV